MLDTCRKRNVSPLAIVHAKHYNRTAWDGSDSMQRAKVLQDMRNGGVRLCDLVKLTKMTKTGVLNALTK